MRSRELLRAGDGQEWRFLQASPWLTVQEDGFIPDFPADEALIVPLELWRLRRDDLALRPERLGLLLTEQDDPVEIAADLGRFTLIAVSLDPAAPSRGCATAEALRALGYREQLWAVENLECIRPPGTGLFRIRRFRSGDRAAPYARTAANYGSA